MPSAEYTDLIFGVISFTGHLFSHSPFTKSSILTNLIDEFVRVEFKM